MSDADVVFKSLQLVVVFFVLWQLFCSNWGGCGTQGAPAGAAG